MKKIGIYDPYLDDVGGGEKYMLSIAETLSKDNQVSIFWDNKEDLDKGAKRFGLALSSITLEKNVFAPHVSTWKRLKETKKYDSIIFLSDGSLPFISSKLYVHIQRPLEHVKVSLSSWLKIKRVRKFFCNSEFTKGYISKTLHINPLVIYPPVDLKPEKIKKENIILHVGRFRVIDKTTGVEDYKKQYIMVDAFKEMVDKGLKNWKFTLAVSVNDNDKEAFEELKKRSQDYPIEFEVNKSNSALWEFYSKAKIYWHASGFGEDLKKHPEFAEHFGISTVEAMGGGCVPVVINAGGQKEVVADGINGFLWDTLEEFKEKTQKLIESPHLLNKLSENAKSRAQDFSKQEFERKIKEMVNG